MEIEIIINTVFANWIYICVWFSMIAFGFGIVYLAISFFIWATINLEGKIRGEKVWRTALKEYIKKRNKGIILSNDDLRVETAEYLTKGKDKR